MHGIVYDYVYGCVYVYVYVCARVCVFVYLRNGLIGKYLNSWYSVSLLFTVCLWPK